MPPVILGCMSTEPPHPSQVRHPWRAVVRTVITAVLALLPILPQIADVANVDEIPAVAQFIATTIVIQRVLSLPAVEQWLKTYIPWMAAEGYHGQHRKSDLDEN